MEYLKTICVADIGDRVRITCLIDGKSNFIMPSLLIYANDFQTELFDADNDYWIKEVLLPQLVNKNYQDEGVVEFRRIIKKEGIKRKEVINLIKEAIKMKML